MLVQKYRTKWKGGLPSWCKHICIQPRAACRSQHPQSRQQTLEEQGMVLGFDPDTRNTQETREMLSHELLLYETFGKLGSTIFFLEYYQTMLNSSLCQRKTTWSCHYVESDAHRSHLVPSQLSFVPFQFSPCQAASLEAADLSPGSVACHFTAVLQTSLNKFRPCFLLFNCLVTKLILPLKGKIQLYICTKGIFIAVLPMNMLSIRALTGLTSKIYLLSAELIHKSTTIARSTGKI